MNPIQGRAAVDNSSWDGNAAMTACGGAACYRAICAGRKSGPADERGSWALPHHKSPGAPPNAAGVRNSLARLPQTQGLTNREEARRHLQRHMASIQAQSGRKLQEESMVTAERRFTAVPVEVRAGADSRKIGGYAALHNTYSSNLGGFVEQFAPSTWNETRGRGWPDVLARYNHDDNLLLGTTGGGTLRLEIDGTGLLYDVTLPQARADVYELVGRGDVRKSSVAFRVMPEGDEWGLTDQGFPLRTVTSAQLIDVAPVNLPAYPDTTAGVRRLVDPQVALRSLAAKAEAELDEVLAAAEAGELRRFLTTESDVRPMPKPKPKLSGAAALAQVQALIDPWGEV